MFRNFTAWMGAVGVFWSSAVVAELAQGVSVGEVTESSAVVWSRYHRTATMIVTYTPATGVAELQEVKVRNSGDDDFTAQVTLTNLEPDTHYRYAVSFRSGGKRSKRVAGTFRTAPAANVARDVHHCCSAVILRGRCTGDRVWVTVSLNRWRVYRLTSLVPMAHDLRRQ